MENRFVVWAIVASQFAPAFMFAGVAVALPAMGADLHAGATALGLVETLFLAGSVAFLLPVGWLADATDKNTLYKLGLVAFAVSSVAIGFLSSVPAILCIRFLQGATSAVFVATGPAILADIVPAERRGAVFGSSLGAIYAGLTLGPIVAGLLIERWGWRAVFHAGAAVLLAGYGLVHFRLASAWRRPLRRLPLPSTLLLVSAVLCVVMASATLRDGPLGYVWLVAGVALGVGFVRLQRRLTHPMIDVAALVGNRVLRNALLVQLLLYMNAFASIFLLSIYMQVTLGRSARTAGQVLAIGSVLMALMAPLAGAMADRVRPRIVATCGVAAVLVSALLATTLDERTGLSRVLLLLAIQGVGFALFSSPNLTMIMNSVSAGSMSMASALGAKSRSLGMVSGMLLTTVLISQRLGHDPIDRHADALVGILTTVFSILAGLTALALVVSWVTRER